MATVNFFNRKVADLRNKYGNEEAEYFKNNPQCEKCYESRLPALTVHHVNGRTDSTVITLCFNCHMIVHAPKSASFTYEAGLSLDQKRRAARKSLDDKYMAAYYSTGSLRAAGESLGVCHNTIRLALIRNNISYDKSRSGHKGKGAKHEPLGTPSSPDHRISLL